MADLKLEKYLKKNKMSKESGQQVGKSLEEMFEQVDSNMKLLTTISQMPEFERLLYCFINPNDSNQLIVLFANKSDKLIAVKMTLNGQIIKEKNLLYDTGDCKIEKVEACKSRFFFVMHSYFHDDLLAYDYTLKRIKTNYITSSMSHIATNQSSLLVPFCDYESDVSDWCLSKYDIDSLEETTDLNESDFDDSGDESFDSSSYRESYGRNTIPSVIKYCLANDKLIYYWFGKLIRVAHLADDYIVRERKFDSFFEKINAKFIQDKWIAVYDQNSSKITVLTQDDRVETVKEHQISLATDKKLIMSTDTSTCFCFFTSDGYIYHNFTPIEQ